MTKHNRPDAHNYICALLFNPLAVLELNSRPQFSQIQKIARFNVIGAWHEFSPANTTLDLLMAPKKLSKSARHAD